MCHEAAAYSLCQGVQSYWAIGKAAALNNTRLPTRCSRNKHSTPRHTHPSHPSPFLCFAPPAAARQVIHVDVLAVHGGTSRPKGQMGADGG